MNNRIELDIQRILQVLPHRYPMVMVDRVTEVVPQVSIRGYKCVSFNEPWFPGHFPGRPIMPGVLLIEGMAQTAGAICIAARGRDRPEIVYFMSIESAKFRKPVLPGDTVEYHVRKIRNRTNIWKFSAEAMVGDAKVAEATISALIADE